MPIRVARTSNIELPLRAASSSTSRYLLAISGSFNSARSRSSRACMLSSRRAMGVILDVSAETVVKGGISGIQFNLVDQFAALGSGQSGRGKLSPPAFRQQEVLDVGGVVGRQLQGSGDSGKHLRRPVESRQIQQAAQVDTGLHRLALQAEVELTCLGPQSI